MFTNSWTQLSHSGIEKIGSHLNKRTLVISNQVSFSLLVLASVVLFSLYITVPENTVMLLWIATLTSLLAIGRFLSSRGKFTFNQFMISTGLPLLLLFSTIHSKVVNHELIHDGSYYNPRYFLIGMCFIPFVIFDLRQRWQLGVSVLVNCAALVFYIPIHRIFGADPESIMGHELSNSAFVTVASSAAGVAIVVAMYFLKNDNYTFERRITELLKKTSLQNDELQAGIRYASLLQESILPSAVGLKVNGMEADCFLRPKDTLSGDFVYHRASSDKAYVSVVDCTGHGVPGAFVSLMAHNAIEAAMNHHIEEGPAAVLGDLQQRICQEFHSNNADIRDGMDLCLCAIDPVAKTLSWSSARGIAFLVKDNDLQVLDAERRSIGDDNRGAFETFNCPYEPGDLLVLTSDGYTDQFGGGFNKKFGKKRFRSFCQDLRAMRGSSIKEQLTRQFEFWKGDLEQTDDVCVLVIRLS